MSEQRFKPGDKVKHAPTGDVLTFKEYGANPWEGWAAVTHAHGNTTAETWWKLEDCEPYVEERPIPVSEGLPTVADADADGLVIWFYNNGERILQPIDYNVCCETHWMHTSEWKPRDPLLGAHCKGCKFNWKLTQEEAHCDNSKWYCDKLKLECLEPHYINGVPCNLAEV